MTRPLLFSVVVVLAVTAIISCRSKPDADHPIVRYWQPPDINSLPVDSLGAQIRYGRELVAHTARYLGPSGSVSTSTNGMNCQNCHLKAGTQVFGNNFGSVASLYPRFRARSGSIESVEKRVNDCLQRSLNGDPLDSLSKEMRALVAYITWLGRDVPRGKAAEGSGLMELPILERAADSARGRQVYIQKCQTCHTSSGEGLKSQGAAEYSYPPLWGPDSYNTAAGLFRLSNFARYVYANMPQGVTHEAPQLTVEEAWDVAAFINSMPRPHKEFAGDWPSPGSKPFDYPFGPFPDTFAARQHKYGPFGPIRKAAGAD
ncbi:MAG: c-type cytochrome [Cyclobacteriaceae bacterium]|jgi:thiosulfate dehydrogenase